MKPRTPQTLTLLAISLAAAIPAALAPEAARADDDLQMLPTHPGVTAGVLDNGMRYLIKSHSNPPGRLAIRMHVSSGSLNETDDQQGIAHYLEHMAFNGSDNFPPGELVPYFESIGLTFGRHQNAFTSFEQTVYMLDLPDTEDETITKGLTFFTDVLGGLLLLPEEIDKERQVVLEEWRRGLGPEMRILKQMLPRILPDSLVAERLPIGTEETLLAMNHDNFEAYYDKWYTTGNATLIVVGDIDPETMLPFIESAFGAMDAGARPTDQDPGVRIYDETFAVVLTDDELTRAEVGLLNITEPRPPSLTVGQLRDDLVSQIASFAFNRRLQKKVSAGDVSFRSGQAFAQDLFGAMRFAQANATGEPEDWQKMLFDLAAEVERARQFGFTEREVEDVRQQILAQFKQLSTIEDTFPGQSYAMVILQAVNQDEPVMSFAQQYELMEKLLPGITPEQVSANFADTFKPDTAAFILELPTGENVPTDDELLKVGNEAVSVKVLAEADEDRPETILDAIPNAGAVAELAMHPRTETMSAWLENGVRTHYKFMDYRENQASVTITLAGGRIQETAATRGLTQAAMRPFSRPAAQSRNSNQLRDLLIGKNVSVRGFAGNDTVTLTVSGAPEDLEAGMQLAHLLLTEPVIEEAAFEQWKQSSIDGIHTRKQQPQAKMGEVLPDVLYPQNEVRTRPLEEDEVLALSRDRAQRWLEEIIQSAPIEVAVVGDIDRDQAMELVTRYIGSLPNRSRMTSTTFEELRYISKPDGPFVREVVIDTQTPQAVVFEGFFNTDARNVRDSRLMRMASDILSTRMIKRIREDEQLVYSIRAFSQPAQTYKGYGIFGAISPTEPSKAAKLSQVIQEMLGYFSAQGPTAEEVGVAKGQVANLLDESMKEPGFWSSQLSDMTYRGTKLDDVADAPEQFQSFSRDEVHDTFNEYYDSDQLISVTVMPANFEE